MNRKQSTKKGGTKGKAEGSKKKLTRAQRARIEAEAEAFKQAAHDYATKAYTAALAHFAATKGKEPGVFVCYQPWETGVAEFEQYQQDGRFFAAILADPACPEGFRRLFDAVWSDNLLGSITGQLGGPYLLPLVYPIVRDAMDASNLCGTAEGIYDTLIKAVEVLVPDEVADRARVVMKQGEEGGKQ
ncbi:MAG TPA: hypothetical protein VF297_32390 [Pyrinomonadaceae bacterium]